jgi:predicted O-methyltransferase YrrM
MNFIDEQISRYSEEHSAKQDAVLAELERETWLKVMRPRMLSGPVQGKLLEFIVKMLKPKEVLEIGTYTGYSAIWMARALKADATLHTIDINPELEDMARKYFAKAGVEHQINFYIGNAMEVIPKIDAVFDLVFIDADKTNYKNYLKLVLPKVRSGGIIIADNVLWNGKVLKEAKNDPETKAIQEFNEYVQASKEVDNLLLPLRDGLMIMEKKS